MQNTPTRDTPGEAALRKALHRRGLRYRVDFAPIHGSRRRPDIVFTRAKVAVFVDGCFWHSCPTHGSKPKHNALWWSKKLARTVARDRETDEMLGNQGWTVVRVWEHEEPEVAASAIALLVRQTTHE